MSENDKYKDKLSDDAYRVCRLGATEHPFSGKYCDHFEHGVYHCACCDKPLFRSEHKFQSGCGWPSFFQSIDKSINYLPDHSHHMVRTEIKCSDCDSHLGHVFDDGPEPTFKRYCVNSVSLDFSSLD